MPIPFTGSSPVSATNVGRTMLLRIHQKPIPSAADRYLLRQGAAAMAELKLENDRLRTLLDAAEAKPGPARVSNMSSY